jgi:dinuclear metal center YbgI/SA1388 family protein
MARLSDIVAFCDQRINLKQVPDFPGAWNGLQFQNNGEVRRIGAAVDAGLVPFQEAVKRKIDFLIVHHGMFWSPISPITGPSFQKVQTLVQGNCAVYGAHLPLDLHPEIGNNALLARLLDLDPVGTFLPYEGNDVGIIASCSFDRAELAARLRKEFPKTYTAVEFGSEKPERVAILTGSGQSAVPYLRTAGVDTFITGELKQNSFNTAQEEGLNLFMCGHYRTETFGVSALAREVAEKFGLEWEFIETHCPI